MLAKRHLTLEDLYQFITVSDPQITPDGEAIAYVRTHIDTDTKEPRSAIWLMPAAGGSAVQFTRSQKSDSDPAWSPDGRRLLFISDRGGDRQLWLMERFGGEARQITKMRYGVGSAVWSPDGKRVAFVSSVGPDDKRELLTRPKSEADKKQDEKRAKDEARSYTRIAYRADSIGFLPDRKAQIWVMEVPGAEQPLTAPIQVTWGSYSHARPTFSPDGARLVFVAKRTADEHARFFDVFSADLPGADSPAAKATPAPLAEGVEAPKGDEAKGLAEGCAEAAKAAEAAFAPICVTGSKGTFFAASFSPDGQTLAVLGHLNEFENATQFKIWLYPVDGSEPRMLDNWDLSPTDTVGADVRPGGDLDLLTWAPDGNVIYVPVSERGACSIYGFPIAGGRPQLVAGGQREIFGYSFDRNCETLAFVTGDMLNISDLYVMDCRIFEEERLTQVNAELFAAMELPEIEEINFKARDGWDLHGWVMKPVGFKAGEQYPLVLEVHGGPHTCYGYAFQQEFHLLAAAGYGVLFINPRGSTSYGQTFVNAVRGDYGGSDFHDLLDAVDHVLALGCFDEKRLAVTGGSYGGFMTNWAVGQTDRFAAAITHRSICNWVSFSGTPDFGPFFNKWQHLVSDPWSPEGVEALWKISPLKYVKNVKTPISIMHSEFDYRCPIEQAEQFYMAIKFYDQAPTELVRHPRSNHDLTRKGPPTLRVDRFRRILKWFGQYCSVNKANEPA
jgi:dipeptidyl aminopeptidase/acylaminoacyl peptidase